MFQFVNYLKVLATILITNSHYSNIWPISAMAAGGLLGNVIFFAVSGFCLVEIKENFFRWYLKRFLRIYPVMAIFTLFTICLGLYAVKDFYDVIRFFVYPTNYIFLVWMMILYAVFYVVAWIAKQREKTWTITFAIICICWLLVYLFWVDKTNYGIDNVSSPFIMFLYFLSMLIGATFKRHAESFSKFKWQNLMLLVASLIVYFYTKILFDKKILWAWLQITNQFAILFALTMIFVVAISLEDTLVKFNTLWKSFVKFVASITLQIYIVQFIVIRKFENLLFPINFLVVTTLIFIFASVVYALEYVIRRCIGKGLKGLKSEKEVAVTANEESGEKNAKS